jgi:hypothetical protein
LYSENYRTQSEQVKNGAFQRGCRWFQLFFIYFQLFYFFVRIIPVNIKIMYDLPVNIKIMYDLPSIWERKANYEKKV